MPSLALFDVLAAAAGTVSTTSHTSTALAVLLPLATLAAGGWGVRRWRQQQQHSRGLSRRQLQEDIAEAGGLGGLLRHRRPRHAAGDDDAVELQEQRGLPPPAPHALPGRAQLKARVQQLLGQQGATVALLAPEHLPKALAHEMPRRPAASPDILSRAQLASLAGRVQPQRQWGLQSDSLRIDAGELEVGCARCGCWLDGAPRACLGRA